MKKLNITYRLMDIMNVDFRVLQILTQNFSNLSLITAKKNTYFPYRFNRGAYYAHMYYTLANKIVSIKQPFVLNSRRKIK